MVLGGQVIYPANQSPVARVEPPRCFLFDNGSLRAASTVSLRRTAARLSEALKIPVNAVSLLHSSGVPTEQLGGVPAQLLEPTLLEWLRVNPQGQAILLPLFFGPSNALTDYVPERLQSIRSKFPSADLRLARSLVSPAEPDTRIAQALATAARRQFSEHDLVRPKVLLVDHGSPQPQVAAVRNHLGEQLGVLLEKEVAEIGVASMERRPGEEYAFNEPLLATALSKPPFDEGNVVILLQFLSPGRHAGPNGDIAYICDEATRGRPSLKTVMTEPIANDPLVVEVLIQRARETGIGGETQANCGAAVGR